MNDVTMCKCGHKQRRHMSAHEDNDHLGPCAADVTDAATQALAVCECMKFRPMGGPADWRDDNGAYLDLALAKLTRQEQELLLAEADENPNIADRLIAVLNALLEAEK